MFTPTSYVQIRNTDTFHHQTLYHIEHFILQRAVVNILNETSENHSSSK